MTLARDNTGSMADAGKIGALKTATKKLLAQLKAAAGTNGDVDAPIIPFSKDVNRDLAPTPAKRASDRRAQSH